MFKKKKNEPNIFFYQTELRRVTLDFLQVEVNGTVLSDEKKFLLEVVKTPLVAVIDGGTTKVVGRKNKEITMDASSSHDPDFPDQGHQIRLVKNLSF